MTYDKSELFINTRKLIFHDKEGLLKNTWSKVTSVVQLFRPPALYLAQVKISVFWDWAPWWAPWQTSSAVSRGSLLEDVLTLPLLLSLPPKSKQILKQKQKTPETPDPMPLLRLDSPHSILPAAHRGISSDYMTTQDDISYVWLFPLWENLSLCGTETRWEQKSRNQIDIKSKGEESRRGKTFACPWVQVRELRFVFYNRQRVISTPKDFTSC